MRDLDDAGRLLALPNPPVNFILLLYAELISMYTIHLPRRARKHYLAGDPPFLNDFSRDEVHQLFGFRTHAQLRRVMIALGVPAIIRTRERYVYPGESAFLLMLVRLRDGRRWSQLERIFHRDGTHLSAINLYMVEWLYTNHSLPRLSNMAWVKARMPLYAQCIVAKLKSIYPQDKWNLIPIDIWSFIDGTIRPCAKPSSRSFPGLNLQVDLYSGYKKIHGVKYQSLHTCDGLCAHMYGGMGARRHDTSLLRLSNVMSILFNMFLPGDMIYRIMGDPAYARTWLTCTGFKGNNLTDNETTFNKMMSSVRIAVEWGFKDINCTWRWLNDKHRNKLGETPLRKHYMNATFLSNLIVCVTGGTQTSAFFECEPPTLEEYLLMTNP